MYGEPYCPGKTHSFCHHIRYRYWWLTGSGNSPTAIGRHGSPSATTSTTTREAAGCPSCLPTRLKVFRFYDLKVTCHLVPNTGPLLAQEDRMVLGWIFLTTAVLVPDW